MTATLAFTLGDLLWSILLALLTGAFFGRWIAREARAFLRPHLGELMAREAKERGFQVLRSMSLSAARKIGFEEEGRLRRFWRELKSRKPLKITTPEYRTPLRRN